MGEEMIKTHKHIKTEEDCWNWFAPEHRLKELLAQHMTDLNMDAIIAIMRRAHKTGFDSGVMMVQNGVKDALGVR